MNKVSLSLLVLILVVLSGCTPGAPGGPGATTSTGKGTDLLGPAEETFRLSPPMLATTLKQGETRVVSLGISRGKNFDEDVSVKFDDLPKGVSIEPSNPVIKHGDTEVKLTVKAAEDAAVGTFNVKVTGHPSKGPDGTTELKLKVEQK
jgi:uncharacterized membrane protein